MQVWVDVQGTDGCMMHSCIEAALLSPVLSGGSSSGLLAALPLCPLSLLSRSFLRLASSWLLCQGALRFAFINPGEDVPDMARCPAGAFAYIMKEGEPIYLPVAA